ncbi:hypothetical protein [Archaeoglobus sp.]
MKAWEEYYEGKRRRIFKFREEDVKITVEGKEYDESEVGPDEDFEEFYKEYGYKDVVKAFRDFLELVEKDWAYVTMRIESNESNTEPRLQVVLDKYYFVADFVVTLDDLCKDSEKLKAIYKKIEEIREILRK